MFDPNSQNAMANLAMQTPAQKSSNFSFTEFRSPSSQVSDSPGDTPSRSRSSFAAENRMNAQRGPKMRLSFNWTQDDSEEEQEPANRQNIAEAVATPSDPGTPNGRNARASLVRAARQRNPFGATQTGTEPKQSITPTNKPVQPKPPRPTARFSVSEYFDAEEGESVLTAAGPANPNPIARPQERGRVVVQRQSMYSNSSTDDTEPETDGDESHHESGSVSFHEGDLVIRDVPPRTISSRLTALISTRPTYLPCTRATEVDTKRLKRAAIALARYDESEEIYSNLVDRLKKMVLDEEENAEREGRPAEGMTRLANKLMVWLEQISEGRIATGESKRFVEHELEWASWLHEAARTRVLHVKTRNCTCRGDWSRDE